MSSDREKLIETWAADWTSGDLSHFLTLFTDSCVYEDVAFGAVHHGKDELKTFVEGIRSSFPDFQVEVVTRFATEDSGSAEWKMSGTHRGDLPGMPATNKQFTIRGASVFEFESERIRRCSDYWDQAALLKQLGFMNSD